MHANNILLIAEADLRRLGAIVGSTRYKSDVERSFSGVRDMFGAVFFVAVGMMVDFHDKQLVPKYINEKSKLKKDIQSRY